MICDAASGTNMVLAVSSSYSSSLFARMELGEKKVAHAGKKLISWENLLQKSLPMPL